jgi:hypothetical protein
MAAVLHDVVEDTEVTLNDLIEEGFPVEVIEAVTALTKLPGETRLSLSRIRGFPPMPRLASRSWDHWSPPSSPGPHPLLDSNSQTVDRCLSQPYRLQYCCDMEFGDVG